jgi:hypothetical protein
MVGVGIAPKQGRSRWWRRGLNILLACAILAGAGLFIDRVVVGPPLPPGAAATTTRLRPIPVSAAACAHVPALHDAAARVRTEYEYIGKGYVLPPPGTAYFLFPTPVRASWPLSRTRLHDDLHALDSAIARAAPTFPSAIQDKFATVRRDIATGQRELATSRGVAELLDNTTRLWSKAVQAFGSASDLVGAQCGTPLGASAPLFGP